MERFKTYAVNLTATSQMTLISSVTGTSVINSINICNVHTASSATISILLNRDTHSYNITKSMPVASLGTAQVVPKTLPIATGDSVVAEASPANVLHVVSSVLEIT